MVLCKVGVLAKENRVGHEQIFYQADQNFRTKKLSYLIFLKKSVETFRCSEDTFREHSKKSKHFTVKIFGNFVSEVLFPVFWRATNLKFYPVRHLERHGSHCTMFSVFLRNLQLHACLSRCCSRSNRSHSSYGRHRKLSNIPSPFFKAINSKQSGKITKYYPFTRQEFAVCRKDGLYEVINHVHNLKLQELFVYC